MNLLQFLSTLLSSQKFMGVLQPIAQLLQQNSFDIKKTLASLDPETLKPIVEEFMKNINNRPAQSAERSNGLKPISNIADKDIIYVLNKYLSQA